MAREIPKGYQPQEIEPKWAEYWVAEALFRADPDAPPPVFSIVIPPPNVTGSLHIGHMLDHTEIDIQTRWHRMRGYNTLYLPGTDHAGISTQRVVVRQLRGAFLPPLESLLLARIAQAHLPTSVEQQNRLLDKMEVEGAAPATSAWTEQSLKEAQDKTLVADELTVSVIRRIESFVEK